MQYISAFTVPAYNKSQALFYERGYYFFPGNPVRKYSYEDIKKSPYLAILDADTSEDGVYMDVVFIAEIVETGLFTTFNTGKELTCGPELDNNPLKKEIWNSFLIHMQNYLYNSSKEEYQSNVPISNGYIKVKNIIAIKEPSVRYKKKQLITLPLQLDENNLYIPNEVFLGTKHIIRGLYFDLKKNALIKNGRVVNFDGTNGEVYKNIIRNFVESENGSFEATAENLGIKGSTQDIRNDYISPLNTKLQKTEAIPLKFSFEKSGSNGRCNVITGIIVNTDK